MIIVRFIITVGFQSTLPVRGATGKQDVLTGGDLLFQSTLPVRGATAHQTDGQQSQNISIHAPREGSDKSPCGLFQGLHHFNPRSP